MANKVKEYRLSKGLSQKKLADLAGTSQQQIQRIETGAIAPALPTASAIAAAMGLGLDKVFPGATTAAKRLQKSAETSGYLAHDQLEEASDAGIEMDPRMWTLKLHFRGREKPVFVTVPPKEYRRMHRWIQREEREDTFPNFIWIRGLDRNLAINIEQLTACHFLFDPMAEPVPKVKEPEEREVDSKYWVRVTLKGQKRRLKFFVDPEGPLMADDDNEYDYEGCPIQSVFCDLETGGTEAHERVSFPDDDGEYVWLRVGDIALFEVSNPVIEQEEDEEAESLA